jgi:Baculovirus P47 protein
MLFVEKFEYTTQFLPQSCKYLCDPFILYALYLNGAQNDVPKSVKSEIQVNSDGFIRFVFKLKLFRINNLTHINQTTPRDVDDYIDLTRNNISEHDKKVLKLICRDRWYKGDANRLKKILKQPCVDDLIKFACNTLWERGYEDHYTLGQQMSIRITTKLIQSGLDFKHQPDTCSSTISIRGWNDATFEKYLRSITSISEIIKRHTFSKKYICLEVASNYWSDILNVLNQENLKLILNSKTPYVLLIEIDDDKNSLIYLKKLSYLMRQKLINVLFVTDVEHYIKVNNFLFYLYNSLKFYYYCLKNKFIFDASDKEIYFLLYTIICLEWYNGGHLNSFTLEKSSLHNPLELPTRRWNSIKRAAQQNRIISCDSEIGMDYNYGKRVRTGTHYGKRIIDMKE